MFTSVSKSTSDLDIVIPVSVTGKIGGCDGIGGGRGLETIRRTGCSQTSLKKEMKPMFSVG